MPHSAKPPSPARRRMAAMGAPAVRMPLGCRCAHTGSVTPFPG